MYTVRFTKNRHAGDNTIPIAHKVIRNKEIAVHVEVTMSVNADKTVYIVLESVNPFQVALIYRDGRQEVITSQEEV
jgi:hypothetical protein